MPWLYEVGMEAYRAIKSGDDERARIETREFMEMMSLAMRGPLFDELETSPRELEQIVVHTMDQISRYHAKVTKRK
jgi:hypothetical protein